MSGPDPAADPGPEGSDGGRDREGDAGRLARAARVVGRRRYRQLRRRLGAIRERADRPVAPVLAGAAPFARVSDLFDYARKRLSVAYLLWLFAGLLGAHRFYLDREGTAALQFFTGGGLVVWWLVDLFLVPSMVRAYNRDQEAREEAGRPPRALDFLETTGEGGAGRADDRAAGRGRLAADLAVVLFASVALGGLSAEAGSWRAAGAVGGIVAVIGFAPELSTLRRVPGIGELFRWATRLGLFYRYHDPGGPLSRAARPLVGALYAPFRRRDRAEVHLWMEIGGAFAILFFLADVAFFGAAAVAEGRKLLSLDEVVELSTRWGAAAFMTMINVYAFASPVGATLYEYVLAGRSHRRVWALGGGALAGLALGWLAV